MSCPIAARYMGGSTSFNGTTSTIPTTLTANTAFTSGFVLHGWIKPKSAGEGNVGCIFDKSDGTSGNNGFKFIKQLESTKFGLQVNGGSLISSEQTNRIPYGTQRHVIVHISSDATVSFYINGVLSGTPAKSGALSGITTTNPLTIGNRSTATDRTFDGNMAELGIISLAGRSDLTAEEIKNLYRFGILPTGATNYWLLDEPASPYTDSIGGNTGTGTATTYSPDTPTQQRVSVQRGGRSMAITGTNKIQVTRNAGLEPSSFTVDTVFKVNTLLSSSNQTLFRKWSTQGIIVRLVNGAYSMTIKNDGTRTLTSTIKPNIASWYRMTASYNSSTALLSIFVDGKLITSSVLGTGAIVYDTNDIFIGNEGGTSEPLLGNIKSSRLWSTALTPTQIRDLHFNGIVPYKDDKTKLVLEIDADNLNAAGTTIPDTSGNGNDGTVTGAVASTDIPPYMTPVGGRMAIQEGSASVSYDGNADYITLTTAITPDTIELLTKVSSNGAVSRSFLFNTTDSKDFGLSSGGFWKVNDGSDQLSTIKPTLNEWERLVLVWNGTGYNVWRKGVKVSVIACTKLTFDTIGRNSTASILGGTKALRAWSSTLTQTEIEDLSFYGKVQRTGLLVEYTMNEGAGTTVNDTSGNANHGTITGATWSADLPPYMIRGGARRDLNDNMVKNGDFSYVPPFVAATTTGSRWIDGTAGGSTSLETAKLFKWFFVLKASSASAQFDENSMKLSTLNATGRVIVTPLPADPASASTTVLNLRTYGIPVSPSTSYIFTFTAKTANIVAGGVGQLIQYNGSGTKIVTTDTTAMATTQDWTTITTTVATNSTASFVIPIFLLNTAGNIADCWIKNVRLTPTTPNSRTAITC